MQSKVQTNANGGLVSVKRPSRPSVAPTRRPRQFAPPRAAVDPASIEVTAALTTLIACGGMVASLASVIRQANGFDARDKAFKDALAAKALAASSPVASVEKTEISAVPAEMTAAVEEIIEEVKQDEVTPIVTVAATEQIEEIPTPFKEEIKEEEPLVVLAAAEQPVEEKIEEQTPVLAIKEEEPEAITLSADDVATQRVTEPTFPATVVAKADPAQAAAVLEALTANAPVGATPPGSLISTDGNGSSNGGGAVIREEEPVLYSFVGAGVVEEPKDDSAAEALRAAREYESRRDKVLADAKLAAETEVMVAAPATQKKRAAQSVVTISEQYQEKIDALLSSYEEKKAQEAALLAKQEKITLDLAALETAQKEAEAAVSQNVIAVALRKVMEAVATIWAYIVALVAKVTGGRFGGSGAAGASSA